MHAGSMYSSNRLYRTWVAIRWSENGVTTDEIGKLTGSRCPGTDVSAVRQSLKKLNIKWEIRCQYERTTKNGSKVYRYRAVRRT